MKIVSQNVELIDSMGSDLSVVNAARVSFHKVSEEFSDKDKGLINYLAKHNHWTPFAHCFLSFRVKAPIFVARQLVKHQVGLAWNEVSRRYVDEEPEFWFPDVWRGRPVNAKQGSDGVLESPLILDENDEYTNSPQSLVAAAVHFYNKMIEQGYAPEQARMILPQNMMTEWIWSGSLMAFARVCKLRLDPHAQAETQEVAQMIANSVPREFDYSWWALMQ